MEPEFPLISPRLHPRWCLVPPGGRAVRDANAPAGKRAPCQDASRRASASRAGRVVPPEFQAEKSRALAAVRVAAKRDAEVPGSSGSTKHRTLGGVAHSLGCLAETLSQVAIMGGDDGGGPDSGIETSPVPCSASDGSPALVAQGRQGELLHVGVTHIREQLSSLPDETAVQDNARRVATLPTRLR